MLLLSELWRLLILQDFKALRLLQGQSGDWRAQGGEGQIVMGIPGMDY